MTRWGRRRKHLLEVIWERSEWKLKEKALDHTLWLTRFEISWRPVVRQLTLWWWWWWWLILWWWYIPMNKLYRHDIYIYTYTLYSLPYSGHVCLHWQTKSQSHACMSTNDIPITNYMSRHSIPIIHIHYACFTNVNKHLNLVITTSVSSKTQL